MGDQAAMERWQALAQRALKGAPLETLDHTTADGAVLAPLYGPAEPVLAARATAQPWQPFARVDDDAETSAKALDDLSNGVTGLTLVFAGAPSAYGRGLSAQSVEALESALQGVLIEHAPLRLEAGNQSLAAAANVFGLCTARGVAPPHLSLGYDPLGALLASGEGVDRAASATHAKDLLAAFDARGHAGAVMRADGRVIAEAGGAPAQELGFALAAFADALRQLTEGGADMDRAFRAVDLALSASQDQFATMAKLRAARRLHRLLAEACGVNAPATIHADTLHRMLSFGDPTTNLLRNTIAAFAAGVGGADSVTVLPHTRDASPFARRTARNIQSLLIEEAHTATIIDPAAGAGALEAATDAIAEAAWTEFQRLEADGVWNAVTSGSVTERIKATANAEVDTARAKERVLVGINQFAPPDPASIRSQSTSAMAESGGIDEPFHTLLDKAMSGENVMAGGHTVRCPALPPSRIAAVFENG